MFTGIVEGIGKVLARTTGGESSQLHLDLGALAEGVKASDSIAVDGACLTVTRVKGSTGWFDVSTETLQRTTLGSLRTGDEVNLERSMRVGDRIGGHFVLGHVDGVGTIASLRPSPGQVTLELSAAQDFISQLIPKGSVAVDGISLTVAALGRDSFSMAIIPHTLQHTTLRRKSVGDRVNIELDVIGKHVARLLAGMAGNKSGQTDLTERFLEEHGFK